MLENEFSLRLGFFLAEMDFLDRTYLSRVIYFLTSYDVEGITYFP